MLGAETEIEINSNEVVASGAMTQGHNPLGVGNVLDG